jgi:non-ribosomal peptide synthetase component F
MEASRPAAGEPDEADLPPFIDAAERHRVLVEWNATETEFPQDKCVHELIEAQVARTPDAIAVVCEGQRLKYAELNARSNRLAHHLRMLGVWPDARVAICVPDDNARTKGSRALLHIGRLA